MRNILECFMFCVLFYTIFHWHNLYIFRICEILWHVFCFFHGLHNVPFYRGKTGHSNGKSWANHHLEEHHLANGDVSMQRNTFLEGKNIHRMGNHSLAPHFMPLYAWNMRNILECSMFLVLCFYIPKRSPLPFPEYSAYSRHIEA